VGAAAYPEESLVLDFDASSAYEKGLGFFPLGVWCDTTNEPLAAMLRRGNAGAYDADDHITLSALP